MLYEVITYSFGYINNFFHRIAVTITTIENFAPASIQQIAQRYQMSFGQVIHMDEIPDAGAVGGRIISTENL